MQTTGTLNAQLRASLDADDWSEILAGHREDLKAAQDHVVWCTAALDRARKVLAEQQVSLDNALKVAARCGWRE